MGVTVLRGSAPTDLGYGYGDGDGDGSGYGYGYGYGYGAGDGYGSGYGYGYGYGYGAGYGYGYGDGDGDGYGSGAGYGYGAGAGSGDGYGSGYGYGAGYGSGPDLVASSPTSVRVTAADIKKAGACSTAAFSRAFPGGAEWPSDRDKALAAGLDVNWAQAALGLLPPLLGEEAKRGG